MPVEFDDQTDLRLRAISEGDVFSKTVVARAVRGKPGEFDVVVSTDSIDRDRERVMPKGLKLVGHDRLPLVSSHFYGDLRKHIGDVTRLKRTDKEATVRVTYFINKGNAEADWAATLAEMGHAAYSVGFKPIKWEDADLTDEKVFQQVREGKVPLRTYVESELMEISHVILPSNRDAIQRMANLGIVPADQAEALMAKAVEVAYSPEAQAKLDEALAAYEAKTAGDEDGAEGSPGDPEDDLGELFQESLESVEERSPEGTVSKPRDEHGCEPGYHWDKDRKRCVKDKPKSEEEVEVEGLEGEDDDPQDPSQREPLDGGTVKVEVDGAIIARQMEAVLDAWSEKLNGDVEATLEAWSKRLRDDVVTLAGEEAERVVRAETNQQTKDLIDAVVDAVVGIVKREVEARAGNVDHYRREQR